MKNTTFFGFLTILLALSGLAEAAKDPTYDDSIKQMTACFERHYDPATDVSGDITIPTMGLLSACSAEWDQAAKSCVEVTGNTQENCNANTGIMAGAFIRLKAGQVQ